MKKIATVAWREFSSTVLTWAFVLGLVLPPVLMGVGIAVSVLFASDRAPAIKGSVAVVDLSGAIKGQSEGLAVPGIRQRMSAEALRRANDDERGESLKQATKDASKPEAAMDPRSSLKAAEAVSAATSRTPELTLEVLSPDVDLAKAKDELTGWSNEKGGRLSLLVISPEVVRPTEGKEGETYQFFTAPKLDPRVAGLISRQVHEAVVEARLATGGLDPARVRALTQLPRPRSTEVTKEGQRTGTGAAQFIIPLAFFMLIWISAFSGAGQLLNNTIEEKSNRIMEVLLSAVSPFQLMAGKILGQLGAGLVIITVYAGVGVVALIWLAYGDFIQPMQLVWLAVFYVLSYLLIASVFAAIGSAVSDIQEANSLMAPAMLLIMVPMFTVFPIIQNPTGTLARVLSFVPPFSPFAMIARVGSNQPPAQWEVALSALVSALGALGAIWLAGKVFRIGVLVYGKPPNFATLLKWVRMA
jgi:ABC-2 type transport system permease protein